MNVSCPTCVTLACVIGFSGVATSQPQPPADWLLDGSSYVATVKWCDEAGELRLSNGLIRRTFRLSPNAATVGLDHLVTDQALLRGVKPEATLTIDGQHYAVGGLVGQPNYAYLLPDWVEKLQADPAAFQFADYKTGEPQPRLVWKRVRHHASDVKWPPAGIHLTMRYDPPAALQRDIGVAVHYVLYDGLPLLSKWISVHNGSDQNITIDRFASELLAVVEQSSWVETRAEVGLPVPDSLHVETDFAFGGFQSANANRHIVHWRPDPQYATQVNYLRETPCLLMVEPTYGPAVDLAPGQTFESCRAFELLYDSTDRERRALALRRMYRTIAPWITENPLMHHMRVARPELVRQAIDDAADVGFEMVVLSFGSGFDMERDDPDYLAQWQDVAEYARSRGVELGAYSLLSSRRIGDGNDIVSPQGQSPTHGNCPALTSPWGREYFCKLYDFYKNSGFSMLEHDGSYPGDVDVTPRPPLQKGEADSQWAQWRIISEFYGWCRGQGIYLNVPDYYYLAGSNKCGMGYREVNWSLPRDMQLIHTRQNIYDGTWTKTPSMGWMFVPLSEYHGGGPAATVEPLDEHRDHYRRMMQANLGWGVQACYRGPRLYDTEQTRDLVRQQVAWFKKYRDILESDVIHGRRADGRDVDWLLHVNPTLPRRGMLVVYNPLDHPAARTLRVNLYYTGLTESARIREGALPAQLYPLGRDYAVEVPVAIPPHEMAWFVIEAPEP